MFDKGCVRICYWICPLSADAWICLYINEVAISRYVQLIPFFRLRNRGENSYLKRTRYTLPWCMHGWQPIVLVLKKTNKSLNVLAPDAPNDMHRHLHISQNVVF